MRDSYDYLIVGAGLSGLVLAERLGSLGRSCLVVEKRDHIGGNCHDRKDQQRPLLPCLRAALLPHQLRARAHLPEPVHRVERREVPRERLRGRNQYWSFPSTSGRSASSAATPPPPRTTSRPTSPGAPCRSPPPRIQRRPSSPPSGWSSTSSSTRAIPRSSGAGPPRRWTPRSAAGSHPHRPGRALFPRRVPGAPEARVPPDVRGHPRGLQGGPPPRDRLPRGPSPRQVPPPDLLGPAGRVF
jgi:hypothetical protein